MKARVIILGGCGFIGRNLVDHLIREDVVSEICVVDKVPPQTAWLSDIHKASFDDPRVTFRSANLINPESCRAAFLREDCERWNWVINCAGETRPGQTDAIYEEGILRLSVGCAQQAAAADVGSFLEFSCCMASNKKVPHREDDPCQPLTQIGQWKWRVEEALSRLTNLRCVIVRPAIVYGPGDRTGLMPLLMLGAIYKHLGESMKLLWSRDVQMNTVHVRDLCRAVALIMSDLAPSSPNKPEVYHVVDDSTSTQGSICDAVANIFRIEHGCWGIAASTVAKSDLEAVAEDVNDKHLPPWAALCAGDGVNNTPLSPHVSPEMLQKHHIHLDDTKLRALGFQYTVPKLTAKVLREVIDDYVNSGLFPKSALS